MLPALKIALFAFLFCFFVCCFADHPGSVLAQNPHGFSSVTYAFSRPTDGKERDPVENELGLYGKRGQLIALARTRTLYILSSENSCSDWFRQVVPHPEEFFRTLRYVVDSAGQSEIIKRERVFGEPEYFHPYIAHTGQDVGPGSIITLNANGAFFKDRAIARSPNAPSDATSRQFIRPLTVADILGDTEQARVLTLLHEFGHVIGLLPLDSGTPSAAFLSVENTQTVLKNCKVEIESVAKLSKTATRNFSGAYLAAMAVRPHSNGMKRAPNYISFRPRQ